MARKPDVRYIQFYTDGTAARQPEPKEVPVKKPRPRKPRYQLVIPVQPLAVGGILVSAVLLIMMVSGSVRLYHAQQARQAMAEYVAHLKWDNEQKSVEYEGSLNLDIIRESALALGMIPEAEADHVSVSLPPVPQEPEQPGFWQRLTLFLEGLFA